MPEKERLPIATDPVSQSMANVAGEQRDQVFIAIVTGNSGNLVLLRRPGQAAADPYGWPKISGVAVVAGNEVLCVRVGGLGVVIGQVVR